MSSRRASERFQPGSVVAGRYRLEGLLGLGGMAEVYRAVELSAGGRALALKVLQPKLRGDAQAVKRFEREARILAELRHPAMVAVEASGELPDGTMYFVMELLRGETLGARMRRGRMNPAALCPIVHGIAAGLFAAHQKGIVHRDLKPDNVFLCPASDGGEQVKLLDFGISKMIGVERLTQTGQVVGTPRYMSPEQLGSEPDVDARVDIYALGVVLYEALGGQVPFVASSPSELIVMILKGEPVPLRAVRPELSPELEAVVMRAMALKRRDRFDSVLELAAAFSSASRFDAHLGAGTAEGLASERAHRGPQRSAALSSDGRAPIAGHALTEGKEEQTQDRERAEAGSSIPRSVPTEVGDGLAGLAASGAEAAARPERVAHRELVARRRAAPATPSSDSREREARSEKGAAPPRSGTTHLGGGLWSPPPGLPAGGEPGRHSPAGRAPAPSAPATPPAVAELPDGVEQSAALPDGAAPAQAAAWRDVERAPKERRVERTEPMRAPPSMAGPGDVEAATRFSATELRAAGLGRSRTATVLIWACIGMVVSSLSALAAVAALRAWEARAPERRQPRETRASEVEETPPAQPAPGHEAERKGVPTGRDPPPARSAKQRPDARNAARRAGPRRTSSKRRRSERARPRRRARPAPREPSPKRALPPPMIAPGAPPRTDPAGPL